MANEADRQSHSDASNMNGVLPSWVQTKTAQVGSCSAMRDPDRTVLNGSNSDLSVTVPVVRYTHT